MGAPIGPTNIQPSVDSLQQQSQNDDQLTAAFVDRENNKMKNDSLRTEIQSAGDISQRINQASVS